MEGGKTSIRRKSLVGKAIEYLNYRKKGVESTTHAQTQANNAKQDPKEAESESATLQFPRESHEYQIIDEIYRGTNSIVYMCRCLTNGKSVAIKCLDLDNAKVLDHSEFKLVSHPNVLSPFCTFIAKDCLWQVMPFMAAGSLKNIVQTEFPDGLEEPIIATILKSVLIALVYIHEQGYIHRDVKLENIYLDSDGTVKLGAFESSLPVQDGYDFRADIWSFGITAIDLAHGCSPDQETIGKVERGFDEDRKFSLALKDMVGMCLVPDPRQRPCASLLLKHRFFQKHAESETPEYVVANLLDKLAAPLSQRIKKMRGETCREVLEAIGKLPVSRTFISGSASASATDNRLSLQKQ
ncbi:hypothetical protein KI387_034569 [Taxus chinensis]|uniref:Protein kinase domain-containing protein n=1 Tax=Taxus chinensis TaxID=29808 RepID=A0AA38C569_TAXCH|nr:hypothetical protein KI387_034569 [Taxus chinensis]